MPLTTGVRLGSYEIVSALGAGGMGEVYRARDTKLNREVAIKIVPEALAADQAALARFQTEAQAVAALSHPNILSIFDVGTEHGTPYAVMELLDGVSLREVLGDAVLPTRKAIEYVTQICAGLAAAHARGITHRDLKPENVFVTRDGRVKILDFGLAKVGVMGAAGAASVQATVSPTTPGTVLGTVGYMSPEQVRGQTVDHRADIFSLGAILYEMLSGQRAFSGPSAVETMNAILKEDPPELTRTNAALPPALDRIVRRCLEKNPDERFQSARDLGFALEALSGSGMSAPAIALDIRTTRRWLGPVLMLALAGVAVAAGIVVGRSTAPVSGLTQPTFETKTFDPQAIFNARFMPDGQTIVYSTALEGNSPELWVNRPGQVAPQSLDVRGVHLLDVSSKGELAVLVDALFINHRLFRGTLARMPIDGAPRPWMENVREADWSPDATTLAVIRDLGVKDRLEYPAGKTLHEASGYLSDVRVSPDGARVALLEHPARYDDRGWVKVVDPDGQVRTLTGEYRGVEGLAWTPDGSTILYSGAAAGMEGYQVHAVPAAGSFDSRAIFPSIASLFLLDINSAGDWIVTSNDDQLSIRAKLPGRSEEQEFPWLGNAIRPRLSKDGRLLLFTDQSQSAGSNYAVVIRKTDGSPPVRLGEGTGVAISPDGTRVLATVFNPPHIVIYPIGPGEPVILNTEPLEQARAEQWLPDGKGVVICGNEPSRPHRCFQQAVGGAPPKPLTPEGLRAGPIAPDGRAMIAIKPDGTKQFLSPDGETRPTTGLTADDQVIAWSEDGKSLFVLEGSSVPARLVRIDPATGRRSLVSELSPPDRAGLVSVGLATSIINDAQAYAYTYWKRVSRLFVVKGAMPGSK